MRYVAFLRAINVGGRTVKMDRARASLTALDLEDVATYIQTGNTFFTGPTRDTDTLAASIEKHLLAEFGFEIPTFVRTIDEIDALLASDPFAAIELTNETRHSIVFLSQPLPPKTKFPVHSPKADITIVDARGATAFSVHTVVEGRVPNPAAFVEKTYGVRATARFGATLEKIAAAARV